MAEVFGIIAGAITVGGLTRRLTPSVLSLKRLWNEVKNAPKTVDDLINYLELVNTVLSDMEMEFSRPGSTVLNERTIKLSVVRCHQAVRDLELLVEDMHCRLTSKRKVKRSSAKVRISIKKKLIKNWQERLQSALQILSISLQISQQNYLM